MIHTPHSQPQKPQALQILSHLDPRMDLPSSEKLTLKNLHKGYEGERKFYKLLKKELFANSIVLYDLLLEIDQTEFQIDSLLILQNTIYVINVKNFDGDFYIEGDKWYSVASGNEIRNPFIQLDRSGYLFRQLLKQLGYHFSVEPYLVFVDPEFFLYQAQMNKPIIFPNQLLRFIKKLNSNSDKITNRQTSLATKLCQRHLPISRHQRLPKYKYEDLKKGIVCSSCREFLSAYGKTTLRCRGCGSEELIETAVMRSVGEFHILFPNSKITTPVIAEWCNLESNYSIRRILKKNMEMVERRKHSYYIFK